MAPGSTAAPGAPGGSSVRPVLEGAQEPMTASVELPILPRPDGSVRPIGVLERGASVVPMERTSGWVNVLPVGLGVMPAEPGGFWVSSRDLR